MEQNCTKQIQKKKLDVKLIVLVGVALAVAIVVMAVLISSLSSLFFLGGLSGRYEYDARIEAMYLDFKGGNKLLYGSIDGREYAATYTLNGNKIIVKTDDTIFGINLITLKGTVSDNKREIVLEGMTFTKK